ncbi:hypothetical protein L1887_29694 [Cichorium endivia]|nr:hypothetical protein L1887_29694 [Cichorium endivia]
MSRVGALLQNPNPHTQRSYSTLSLVSASIICSTSTGGKDLQFHRGLCRRHHYQLPAILSTTATPTATPPAVCTSAIDGVVVLSDARFFLQFLIRAKSVIQIGFDSFERICLIVLKPLTMTSLGTSKGVLEIAKFAVYVTVPIGLMYFFANNTKNLTKFMGARQYVVYPPEGPRPQSPEELREMAREIARKRGMQ